MWSRRMVRQALRLGLLVTLAVLALSACGGGEKKAKARPLPEDPKALRPGPMPQGVSYVRVCRLGSYIRKLIPIRTRWCSRSEQRHSSPLTRSQRNQH